MNNILLRYSILFFIMTDLGIPKCIRKYIYFNYVQEDIKLYHLSRIYIKNILKKKA